MARAAGSVQARQTVSGGEFGSPETVAQKIVWAHETLGIERFDLKYDSGTRHEDNLRTIELFGTEVVPRVRALLGE